jgi:hypothetical protein
MQEKITRWYKQGLWTAEMVRNAIDKGILSEEQVEAILNEKEE